MIPVLNILIVILLQYYANHFNTEDIHELTKRKQQTIIQEMMSICPI